MIRREELLFMITHDSLAKYLPPFGHPELVEGSKDPKHTCFASTENCLDSSTSSE